MIAQKKNAQPSTDAATTAPPGRLRVAVQNVGCKLNHYEVEALRSGFAAQEFEVVAADAPADVYVVNTCTVTGSGDADSRKALRRARRLNPGATVVATGCYAQRRPGELRDAGAEIVIGNGQKVDLVRHVQEYLDGGGAVPEFDPAARPVRERFLTMDGDISSGRTRATLQIQDGCDEHCTYCIIPTVRGPSVSRPLDEILAQAQRLAASGHRELALTGVHSGSYGDDQGEGLGLVTLLDRLERISGIERIRLNSVEPGCVSDALIEFAATPRTKLCRHFHIPMQSGDDRILKRMGRRYDCAFYAERLRRLAAAVPDCALGADIMVGFPGEDETRFGNTLAFTSALPLTYLHVFTYSARDDTPALRLDEHVIRAHKRGRARRLIELGESKRMAFHARFLDRRVSVLTEEVDDGDGAAGLATGLTDNYMRVRFVPPAGLRANELVEVTVTQAREDVVFGEAGSRR